MTFYRCGATLCKQKTPPPKRCTLMSWSLHRDMLKALQSRTSSWLHHCWERRGVWIFPSDLLLNLIFCHINLRLHCLVLSEKKNQRIGDSNSGTLKWMLWKAPPGLASSSGHMKISPAAQCLRQGVEQLRIRRDDSFPKEVTGTVRLEFCRVGSLGILMLLCAVKARQIRSCLNEALIALHSNVTNNPECGTLSLFCSSSFIWRLREFETIHYSWSWLLFFATKSFCFTVIGPCL